MGENNRECDKSIQEGVRIRIIDKWTQEVIIWHSKVNWDAVRPKTRIYPKALRMIMKHISLNDEKRILDVGCGSGLQMYELLSHHPSIKITGVDLSDEMLKKARDKLSTFPPERYKIIRGDVKDIKFRNNFDRVIMIDLLGHLNDPLKVCKKLYSALKKDGRMVIITPSECCLYRVLKYPFMAYKPPTRFYSKKEIRELLNNAGFNKIYFDKIKLFDLPFVPTEEHVAIAVK